MQAIYALTGAVASTEGSVTVDIYDTIREALNPPHALNYVEADYFVGGKTGAYIGALYLHKITKA